MARYRTLAEISVVLFVIAFLMYGLIVFPISVISLAPYIESRIIYSQLISIMITYIIFAIILSEVAALNTWRFLKALTVSIIFLSFYALLDVIVVNKQYSMYPSNISLYMFMIIMLILSLALIKSNDRVLKIFSLTLQAIMTTIFLTTVMVQIRILNVWAEIIPMILLTTLLTIWFTTIERSIGIFHGFDKPVTCFIKVFKKILLSISALILLSILSVYQYNNSVVYRSIVIGLGSESSGLELINILISHLTIIGIVMGFGAVVAYIFSPQGYKAIITAIKYFKGESLNIDNLLFYELIDKSVIPVPTIPVFIEAKPAVPPPPQPMGELQTPMQIQQPQQQVEQQRAITETKTPSYVTKKCSFCAKDIPSDSQFCPYCGAYLTTDEGTTIYTSEESKEKEQRSN